jgi:hypothetical protein
MLKNEKAKILYRNKAAKIAQKGSPRANRVRYKSPHSNSPRDGPLYVPFITRRAIGDRREFNYNKNQGPDK